MKRLIREPLVHFVLLGAGLFLAYSLVETRPGDSPGAIVVTPGKIEHLTATFVRVWQRPPTESELDGLIQDYVREEVYAREAVALGLDRDDTVIRRRLRQKLEFVAEDIATQAEPTDEDLRVYLKAHPEEFAVEPRFTFSQVYLSPERRRDSLVRDAAQELARLARANGSIDLSELGDPFLLDQHYTAASARDIAKDFGRHFAAALDKLPAGRWQGPIESAYGLHLVFVRERTEGRLPALEEVRDGIRRNWADAQRLDVKETFYRALLRRYTVTIEKPQPAGDAKKMAEARR